ncbi:MAG: hypothetical protein K2H85_06060 [Allobaculum sp.]|nr:hypothetical protein [Allobaculum sp.]
MHQKKKQTINRKPLDKNFLPILLALPTLVLHESYGWGAKKRIPDFVEQLMDKVAALQDGRLDVAKTIEELERLSGVKIR